MQGILNFLFGFMCVTAVVSLTVATVRGIKNGLPKTLVHIGIGVVWLIVGAVWYWFVYFSGLEAAQPIRSWITETGISARDYLHELGTDGTVPMLVMFVIRSVPFWLSLVLGWLAIRESDSANTIVQAKVDEELQKAAFERSVRILDSRRKKDGDAVSATVNTDLTDEEAARYRMKAKHGGLTEEEKVIWSKYLQKLQREGKWNPEENAYNNRKVQKEEFDWHGAFVKSRKALVTCALIVSVCIVAAPSVVQFMRGETPVDTDSQFGRDGFTKVVISKARVGEDVEATGAVHMESELFPASVRKAVTDGYDRYVANGGGESFERYVYLMCWVECPAGGLVGSGDGTVRVAESDDAEHSGGLIVDFIYLYRAYQAEGGTLSFNDWSFEIVTGGNQAMVNYLGQCGSYIEFADYRNAGGTLGYEDWLKSDERKQSKASAKAVQDNGGDAAQAKSGSGEPTVADIGGGSSSGNGGKQTIYDLGSGGKSSSQNSGERTQSAPAPSPAPSPTPTPEPAPQPEPAPAPEVPEKTYPNDDGIPWDDGNGGYSDEDQFGGNGTWSDTTTDMTPDRDSPLWNIPDSLF